MDNKELTDTVILFCDALKKFGKTKVLKTIQNINNQNISDKTIEITECIIDLSCYAYGVNKNELYRPKISFDATIVRDLCIALMFEHTNTTNKEIAKLFLIKSPSAISHSKRRISEKNPKIKQDLVFIERFDLLGGKVIEFKATL